MGIAGLHKGLTFCRKKSNVRDFSGQTFAIDSSSWLHKSVYSVSERYVESMERGCLDASCVQVSAKYVTSRCQELLQSFGIRKVYLVMDGKRCPLKADTNNERERRRQENLKDARNFKRQGRRDKAEEKYKTCIKIKDELTIAVMKSVARHFAQDRRVEFVWSPYEADSQLVKLCVDRVADVVVTEDSDVLVYSAAAHVSFPILFKVDRGTGACDMLSMDWLLNPPPDEGVDAKGGSALETLLKNLASRQARRPGFGVRLFVQACVLSGCDYAANQLAGVGLVNAFKLIRDNAHRNDSNRFEKALTTLTRKARGNVDLKEYELILAKSEAIFYYHLVRHADGTIRPLNNTRLNDQENGDVFTDHAPAMERFAGDWSFLGSLNHTAPVTRPSALVPLLPPPVEAPPVSEITVPLATKRSRVEEEQDRQELEQESLLSTISVLKMSNPYRVAKKRKEEERQPFKSLSPNKINNKSRENPFSKFAKKDKESKNGSGSMLKYLQSKEDVRFVKRNFNSIMPQTQQKKSLGLPRGQAARNGLFSLHGRVREDGCRQEPQIDDHGDKDYMATSDPAESFGGSIPDHGDLPGTRSHAFEYPILDEDPRETTMTDAAEISRSQGSEERWNYEMALGGGQGPDAANLEPPCEGLDTRRYQQVGITEADTSQQMCGPFTTFPVTFEIEPQRIDTAFFDLTDSNSGHAAISSFGNEDKKSVGSERCYTRLHIESSPTQPPRRDDSISDEMFGVTGNNFGRGIYVDPYDVVEEPFSPPYINIDPKETVKEPERDCRRQSKYFKTDPSRRVTIDPSERLEEEDDSTSFDLYENIGGRDVNQNHGYPVTSNGTLDTNSPPEKASHWKCDEIVESPENDDATNNVSLYTNPFAPRLRNKTRRPGHHASSISSKNKRGGPLESAFRRQQNLAIAKPARRSSAGLHSDASNHSARLDRFFQPIRRSTFSQLDITVQEPDDDF